MANFSDIFGDDDVDPITVELPHPDGPIQYEVYPPTVEQLLLLSSAMSGGSSTSPAAAVLDLVQDLFDEDDYETIRTRLRARRNDPTRLRLADLMTVLETVVEARADFPTQPSSASSPSSKPTGRRSTGRVRSPALTPAASPSDD